MIYILFAMGFLLVWVVSAIRSLWFAVMHTLQGEGSELFTDDVADDNDEESCCR